ncbi:MAG: TerD family protein [Myxococcota bacterium]|nr:TerD family protein [Myxococcota bacterium]
MSIALKAGQTLSIKENFGDVQEVGFGFGWGCAEGDLHVELNCFMLDKRKKFVEMENGFTFEESVMVHPEDQMDGANARDLLQLNVDFRQVPAAVEKLVFVANLFHPDWGDHFGQISNAYIRLFHKESGREKMRFLFNQNSNGKTVMVLMQLIRGEQGWEIQSIGQGKGRRLVRLTTALANIGIVVLIILVIVNAVALHAIGFFSSALLLGFLMFVSITWERDYVRSVVKRF